MNEKQQRQEILDDRRRHDDWLLEPRMTKFDYVIIVVVVIAFAITLNAAVNMVHGLMTIFLAYVRTL